MVLDFLNFCALVWAERTGYGVRSFEDCQPCYPHVHAGLSCASSRHPSRVTTERRSAPRPNELYSARQDLPSAVVEDPVRAQVGVRQFHGSRKTVWPTGHLPMSMDVHFLAGSWQMGGHGCLCMLSDVTLDERKPLFHSVYRGFDTRVWSFDSPRLHCKCL